MNTSSTISIFTVKHFLRHFAFAAALVLCLPQAMATEVTAENMVNAIEDVFGVARKQDPNRQLISKPFCTFMHRISAPQRLG